MAADVSVPPAATPAPARRAALAGLTVLVAAGGAVAWGSFSVPGPARMVTEWGGGAAAVALAAAVAVAAHCAASARANRRRAAALEAAAATLRQQVADLAERTLPAVAQRVRTGVPGAAALAEVSQPGDAALARLLVGVTRELEGARQRASAAMSGAAAAAARIQAHAARMLAELWELETRHGEEPVFGSLLDLDHLVSQAGRLADSIVLLGGGRTGRRWTRPIAVESILRGAMGRIDGYRRVRLRADSPLAVSGHAAEGVMHALAELMDNATRFSAPGSEVRVTAQEEGAGLLVVVEDDGVGLDDRTRRRAESLVAGAADLSTLPGSGLGLACVGRAAARYGLTVTFRPAPGGGTSAALLIPGPLLVAPGPATPPQAGPAAAGGPEQAAAAGDDGLPRRAPGRTLAGAAGPAAAPGPENLGEAP